MCGWELRWWSIWRARIKPLTFLFATTLMMILSPPSQDPVYDPWIFDGEWATYSAYMQHVTYTYRLKQRGICSALLCSVLFCSAWLLYLSAFLYYTTLYSPLIESVTGPAPIRWYLCFFFPFSNHRCSMCVFVCVFCSGYRFRESDLLANVWFWMIDYEMRWDVLDFVCVIWLIAWLSRSSSHLVLFRSIRSDFGQLRNLVV